MPECPVEGKLTDCQHLLDDAGVKLLCRDENPKR
jgi:hypothetical protein